MRGGLPQHSRVIRMYWMRTALMGIGHAPRTSWSIIQTLLIQSHGRARRQVSPSLAHGHEQGSPWSLHRQRERRQRCGDAHGGWGAWYSRNAVLLQITHILSVHERVGNQGDLPCGFTRHRVPIADASDTDIISRIVECNDFIHQARLTNGTVTVLLLVHCSLTMYHCR